MRDSLLGPLLLVLAIGAPLPAAEPETADNPSGVRLRWLDRSDRSDRSPVGKDRVTVEWRMTGEQVEELLGIDCRVSDWSGERACHLVLDHEGWWADFGDDKPRAYKTFLRFMDGRFYQYLVTIQPDRFHLVEDALVGALGEPGESTSSEVENRMGAKFDQELRQWDLPKVGVVLLKRAATVTEGLLAVTYKPIAAEVPEEKVEAPFGP